jgi:hypothetical protein
MTPAVRAFGEAAGNQILFSPNMLRGLSAYDVVHVNSEFADQASDHDPSVARVKVLGGGGG